MIEIQAEWDKKELELLLNRINSVVKEVRYQIQGPGELPRQLSIKYAEEVRGYIIKQEFAGTYKAYNKDYAAWKAEHGKESGFWQLMGKLFTSIKGGFRVADGFYGGIPYGSMGAAGTNWSGLGPAKPIVMYGRVMEEGMPVSIRGSGVHPKRSLFEPAFRKFVYSRSKVESGVAWRLADNTLMKIADRWEGK